ncbi:Acetyltransferase (GNAT) domain-containing protein [Zobellia uliginosa]|uniref:Acetyltransferase (GNAT) domain-containing protein n=1 Tax=Zobellia uliginosa TaxID=143224 RepID=A0ABY1KMU8_9FLAO|nr:GNAT family N-acetyltransferase [Zobellia uliginosa]SIS51007.1 Acetyltransferase (GNAT) domain-containing protein [Zobellia uliginosa]
MIKNNPFLSDSYTSIWSNHFDGGKKPLSFDFFENIQFYKYAGLPLYINSGKTLTKGMDYGLLPEPLNGHRKKVFLIYDVPTYFNTVSDIPETTTLKLLRSKQYPGFAIELGSYANFKEYMLSTFSKSSRYKLNKYKKRFEACFDITYKMYHGDISKETYDFVFESFKELLTKRFDDKQITNNNLNPEEWRFYYDVAYPLILEKKASLFVIYDREKPIGVTLNYHSDSVLFDAITVFDIDYAKFHLGSVTIMKLIEYCLAEKIEVFDFSKGYFDYKTRWSNTTYDFEYHIFYDASSVTAKTLASALKRFFDFKQKLRDKNINERLHRFTYKLRHRKTEVKTIDVPFTFHDISSDPLPNGLTEVNLNLAENRKLRMLAFEFLYLNDECFTSLKAFTDISNQYYFIGTKKKVKVSIT